MTEEQELQLEMLRAITVGTTERISRRRLDAMCTDGFANVATTVCTHSDCSGVHYKAAPTKATHLILTLAAERDLLRLRVEEFEAKENVDRARKAYHVSVTTDMAEDIPTSDRTKMLGRTLDEALNAAVAASKAYAEAVGKSKE